MLSKKFNGNSGKRVKAMLDELLETSKTIKMGLVKKPSELEVKQTLSCMIYGQPGIGKSTLACSAPAPVMLDFDGGVGRINGAHQVDTVQISKWEDVKTALDEIRAAGTYSTVIIDTVGKMLTYMEDYIKRTNASLVRGDGSLMLQGYGKRKRLFLQLLADTAMMGTNVVFVAHEVEEKRGDDTVVRPDISGKSCNDLVKELDLVGYMEASGKERTICFDPTDRHYAKNTCNLYGALRLPELIDAKGQSSGTNDFLCRVIDSYKERQRVNLENSKKCEALVAEIRERAESIKTPEDANNFADWVSALQHIYNSKAVARNVLAAKTAGMKFNKVTKKYEA
jgi:phage nucleotide-binding protein